jgi:peptidyl-prolyl cis-trans isomerase C
MARFSHYISQFWKDPPMRPMRSIVPFATALAAMAALAGTPALAQTSPPKAAPAPAASPAAPHAALAAADPVMAKVGDQNITRSDIADAAMGLPDEYRSMPPATLFPMILDQLIDRAAIVDLARKQGLEKDPEVKRQIANAEADVLQNALLSRVIAPLVTEDAIRARYNRDVAGKPGEEEVHARHILVATQAQANKIIAQLKKGADFATLAKQNSTDPGAAQGGDLGFFKKGDMLPAFSAAAFAMKPGQFSDKPVHTQYGWHVIKVEGRRAAPPPTFEEAHDSLRQAIIHEAVTQELNKARAGVQVVKYNLDGSVQKATDTAQPPPAPK